MPYFAVSKRQRRNQIKEIDQKLKEFNIFLKNYSNYILKF